MLCEHPREVKDSSFNAFLNEDRSFIISWWALKESEAAFFFEGRPEHNFFSTYGIFLLQNCTIRDGWFKAESKYRSFKNLN